MLKAKQHGAVTDFKMGRHFGKFVLYYVHSFLVGNTLIDTSTAYVGNELVSFLENTNIKTIINTHHHEDHTGNNLLLQEKFGAEIYAHPFAIPLMNQVPIKKQRLYLRVLWNYPEPTEAIPLGNKIQIDSHLFKIIHTPGHSPDHICLYEPDEQWLFTGDIYCGERVRYLRKDENFNLLLESLKKISQLEVKTIFCAVSGVVADGETALQRKIEFMDSLSEKVWSLYREGKSPSQIRSSLLGKEGAMYWASAGHFSKQNLVNSILGLTS